MDHVSTLRSYGLFDAKVPRYTSYPPANRFERDVGHRHQADWLAQVSPDEPVSVYVHIPFCRRLCWFCACRTQGTQTLSPVDAYMDRLLVEIETVARDHLPRGIKMGRLHLGGGTPTLLSGPMMDRLLTHIHRYITPSDNFEFSVEIDPTDASAEVLAVLSKWSMQRASIGVQDFDEAVQQAIGRLQGYDLTRDIIEKLRDGGVQSLNVDFLYGLPHQSMGSLMHTIDAIAALSPDRLALYGYAHVPHVSKRQVMISGHALPDAEARFVMQETAGQRLTSIGYDAVGIDHFALPTDSLAQAAQSGRMKRNFQGYTDDPCATLIGFGASAISKFPQGYLHNAVSTAAYSSRVEAGGLAAHKGYVMTKDDNFIAALINGIMCEGALRRDMIAELDDARTHQFDLILDDVKQACPDAFFELADGLVLKPKLLAASRLIAARVDRALHDTHIHSMAV